MDNKPDTILLAEMTTCLVLQENKRYGEIILELKNRNQPRPMVYEAILQSYLHDGYATALEGLCILKDVWPDQHGELDQRSISDWEKDGEELFYKIYGSVGNKVRSNIGSISPELSRWMVTEGYGKVLSRNHLDVKTREILTVVVLTIKSRKTQLYSHIRGALRVGVQKDVLHRVFDMMNSYPLEKEIALSRELLDSL